MHFHRLFLFGAVALAACSERPATDVATTSPQQSTASAAPQGGACPAAERIGLVTDMTDVFDQSGPVLVFHGIAVDIEPSKAGLSETRRFRELSEKDAGDLGIRVRKEPVWVLADDGRKGCQLRPRRHVLYRGKDPWEHEALVGIELVGDCDVDKSVGRLATQQEVEPALCRVRKPTEGKGVLVQAPAAPTALREGFAGGACAAPCEVRRRVTGLASEDGRRVEWTAAAHIHKQQGVEECNWQYEDFLALLAGEADGRIHEVKTNGLDEVLIEGRTVAAFVDRDIGRLTVWGWPQASVPTKAGEVQYRWAHEEDSDHQSLSTYCGP